MRFVFGFTANPLGGTTNTVILHNSSRFTSTGKDELGNDSPSSFLKKDKLLILI